jgi:adenylate cyclase
MPSARAPGRDSTKASTGWPIASVLTVCVALLLSVALASASIAGYLVARSNTTELVREKAALVVESLKDRIRGHLDPVYAQVGHIAELIETGAVDIGRREELALALMSSLAAVPQESTIAFVSPDLTLLRAFRNRPTTPIVASDWSDDPGFRQMMSEAKRAGEPYWGELFVAEPTGAPLINLLWPVRSGERYLGTLIAGVSIFEISDFLRRLRGQHLEHGFILYDRDRALAHAALHRGFPVLNDDDPLPALGQLGDPVLANLWSAERVPGMSERFSNGVRAEAIEVDGETFVVLYQELSGYGSAPWLIGTYLPLDTLAPQLRRLSLLAWIIVLVLGVGLILSLLIGQSLSRPIRRLATAVGHVEHLDLETAPTLRRSRFRELNELTDAYTTMLGGLRLFAAYVPRSLVRSLIRLGHAVDPEEREVTILFTDLVGFTGFAEDRAAEELADLLNRHFAIVYRCVEQAEGVLDKYIGDSAMAFWGAPLEQPDHAARACRAAIAIADSFRLATAGAESERPLKIRIGIHTGRAVVGNIGAPGRVDYTIIGDAVNTTQRLEELARDLGSYDDEVYALVSAATRSRLGEDLSVTSLGRHLLRGRRDPLEVYRLDRAHVPARPATGCAGTRRERTA